VEGVYNFPVKIYISKTFLIFNKKRKKKENLGPVLGSLPALSTHPDFCLEKKECSAAPGQSNWQQDLLLG